MYATGTADKMATLQELVEQVDRSAGALKSSGTAVEAPQFMAHNITTANPDAVLRVLQTLFVGEPTVRIEIDQSTGGVIAYARPAQHRTIQATIAEMEQRPERF